jgi:hypothetical protein
MAASENELHGALEQRFKGDRSGACIAAAVIENGTEARAYFCAGAKSEGSIDDRTAFEIGSITKTMTAALLADMPRVSSSCSKVPAKRRRKPRRTARTSLSPSQ